MKVPEQDFLGIRVWGEAFDKLSYIYDSAGEVILHLSSGRKGAVY